MPNYMARWSIRKFRKQAYNNGDMTESDFSL